MKRIISIVLLCAMMVPSIACAADTDEKTVDTTVSQESIQSRSAVITNDIEPIDEDLEALDYGGEKIVVLERAKNNYQVTQEFFVEELNNDPINDALYYRNLAVSELLGVEFVQVEATGLSEIQEKVDVMVNSGDSTYDIVAGSAAYAPSLILRGEVYDLYDNGIDTYLDTTKPWWPQYWIEEAEIDGKLYCLTGGPALSLSRLMVVWFYNKSLGESHNIESLYDVVNEGRWTIDYVSELTSTIYRDLNGNDLRDEEDEYGISIDNYDNVDTFWSGFNMKYIEKNSSGVIELNTADNEKLFKAYEKIYSLIYENEGSLFYRNPEYLEDEDNYKRSSQMFANGTVLLAPLHLQYAEYAIFRNMKDEYGILPTPKYDEAQDSYYTYVHDQYSMFMIPITVRDPEMSGAVLEAMAYESYKTLMPAYFETALKGRYANDIESRQMIDMITNNVVVDTAIIYGAFFNYPAANILRSNMGAMKTSCVSSVEGYARKMPATIKALRSELDKLDY